MRSCAMDGALTLQKGTLRARAAERKTEKEKLKKKVRERERERKSRASACALVCYGRLAGPCPLLVLVLAAPLNSVGLCGPVYWRGVCQNK